MSPCCWRWAGHAAVCKWELTSTPSTFFPLTHYSSYLQAERHLERTRVTTDRQPQHFSSTDEFGCFKNKKACSHLNFRWKLHLPFNNYLYLPSWLYFFFSFFEVACTKASPEWFTHCSPQWVPFNKVREKPPLKHYIIWGCRSIQIGYCTAFQSKPRGFSGNLFHTWERKEQTVSSSWISDLP